VALSNPNGTSQLEMDPFVKHERDIHGEGEIASLQQSTVRAHSPKKGMLDAQQGAESGFFPDIPCSR